MAGLKFRLNTTFIIDDMYIYSRLHGIIILDERVRNNLFLTVNYCPCMTDIKKEFPKFATSYFAREKKHNLLIHIGRVEEQMNAEDSCQPRQPG